MPLLRHPLEKRPSELQLPIWEAPALRQGRVSVASVLNFHEQFRRNRCLFLLLPILRETRKKLILLVVCCGVFWLIGLEDGLKHHASFQVFFVSCGSDWGADSLFSSVVNTSLPSGNLPGEGLSPVGHCVP